MKKLSIKIATAALTISALPLTSGCGDSSATDGANPRAEIAPAYRPASSPLKQIAVPPTLQMISFNDDLFGGPPTPNLSADDAAAALELAEAVERAASQPEVVIATDDIDPGERLDSSWAGTKVSSEPPAVRSGRLPPLVYPSSQATPPSGTRFDYAGVGEPEPNIDAPLVPPTNDLEPYTLAPPANADSPSAPRDSAWNTQASPAEARDSLELPLELNSAADVPLASDLPRQQDQQPTVYQPAPPPASMPNDLDSPMLVDTSEWSRKPVPAYHRPAQAAPPPQQIAAPYAQQFPKLTSPVLPAVEAPPQVTVEPLQLPLQTGGAGMQVVRHHADMLIQRGTRMGERGALYSAKNDFKHALRLVAEAQDAASGDRRHSEALARGWQALREASDFSPDGAETVDLPQVVSAHRTEVLVDAELNRITPLEAMQRYFAYAQEQLSLAGGNEPVAAEAMHRLGKTHAFIARESSKAARSHGPRALALQQAALMVDDGHDGAANELGVLLAKYGQWNDARRVMLHAISIRPTAEKWQNLAVVHDKLGEGQLAMLARQEAEVATMQSHMNADSFTDRIQWVAADHFARSGTTGRAVPAAMPQHQPVPEATESPTAWKLPWFK